MMMMMTILVHKTSATSASNPDILLEEVGQDAAW